MLKGDNIILRPLKISDIEIANKWRNDFDLIKLTLGIRFPKTFVMDQNWFNAALVDTSNRNIYFGVEENHSSELIGIIQLNQIDYISQVCDFGIVIGNNEAIGKGYGKEAMYLLFNYGFEQLHLRKICLKVVDFNTRAIELYKKVGFVEEGCLKNHVYYDGKYHNVYQMALFNNELR